jgi:hypothetical protein
MRLHDMGVSIGSVFGKPIHRQPQNSAALCNNWAKIGVEVEVENCGSAVVLTNWSFKGDGSLRGGGVEYVTNGGLCGRDLEEAIALLLKTARTRGWSDGHPRAAIHIHLDVTDLGEIHNKQFSNLVSAYLLFEHAMFGFAGEWRRWCGFCDAVEDSRAEALYWSRIVFGPRDPNVMYQSIDYISKYQALNLRPLEQFGTLEFRHLPTTFDTERVIQWVNFILSLKNFADTTTEDTNFLEWISKASMAEVGRAIFGRSWETLQLYTNQKRYNAAKASLAVLSSMWDTDTKFERRCASTKITNKELLKKLPKKTQEEESSKIDDMQPMADELARMLANAGRGFVPVRRGAHRNVQLLGDADLFQRDVERRLMDARPMREEQQEQG